MNNSFFTHLRHWTFFILFWVLGCGSCAFADIGIVHISDKHSFYQRTELFIRFFAKLREERPGVTWILVDGGDIGGQSPWAIDFGDAAFDSTAMLSDFVDVIGLPGNHDGTDWFGESRFPPGIANENALIFKQYARFNARVTQGMNLRRAEQKKQKSRLLFANHEPPKGAEQLFQPYWDWQTPSGKPIRFVGLMLDDFYQRTLYNDQLQPAVFGKIRPMLEVAKEQIMFAAKEDVETLILVPHENFDKVVELVEQIEQWRSDTNALSQSLHLAQLNGHPERTQQMIQKVRNIKLPLVLANHDHQRADAWVRQTRILDSNAYYDCHAIVLDDTGQVVKEVEFWDEARQANYAERQSDGSFGFDNLTVTERNAVNQVKQVYRKAESENRTVLANIELIPGTKAELRRGQHPLGAKAAEAHVLWAKKEGYPGAIAMFNSRSWRLEKELTNEKFTVGDAKLIYNMPGHSEIFPNVTGAQLNEIYRLIFQNQQQEGVYGPQLNDRFRWDENSQQLFVRMPSTLGNEGSFLPILPTETYHLVLCKWLAMNGFGIEPLDAILRKLRLRGRGPTKSNRWIFRDEFPVVMASECLSKAAADLLGPKRPQAGVLHRGEDGRRVLDSKNGRFALPTINQLR